MHGLELASSGFLESDTSGMTISRVIRAFALAAASICGCLSPDAARALSPQEVYEVASQSGVTILVKDRYDRLVAQGSGVVVAKHLAVTNFHVVEDAVEGDAARVDVVLKNGTTHTAAVGGINTDRDLALLHVAGIKAPPARLGSARTLVIGERVYAVGAPTGLAFTFTEGIISQFRETSQGRIIQTSTPVSPGSSGGGLFNADGALVGITTAKRMERGSEGLTFAVPVEWVIELAPGARGGTPSWIWATAVGVVLLAGLMLGRPLVRTLASYLSDRVDRPSVGIREAAIATSSEVKPRAQPNSLDYFRQTAAAELSRGKVDEGLWQRVRAQVGDDVQLAESAYLQARAKALHEADRQVKWTEATRAARAAQVAEDAWREPVGITSARPDGLPTNPHRETRAAPIRSGQPHPEVTTSSERSQHRLLNISSRGMLWIVLAYFFGIASIGFILAGWLA